MAKKISFNVPTTDGVEMRDGYVMWGQIGDRKVKLVLQIEGDRPAVLAHYASGYRLANLSSDILLRYVMTGYRDSDMTAARRSANSWINRAVAQKGATVILEKLAMLPVLNGE